ncbi:MAG: class I SAM-dependent rRNA methyltransferase [Bacteroidota bacterium]
MKEIHLASGREKALLRQHPWVFSGGIARETAEISDGERVKVLDKKGQILGIGHYQNGSIRVRILQFGAAEELPPDFWHQKIQRAKQLREVLQLIRVDNTAYRLIHGAGDGLPGLIIDIYGAVAVVQCHSIGMFRELAAITDALRVTYGPALALIYNRSESTLSNNFRSEVPLDGPLWGQTEQASVSENGHRFFIDFANGQKTGFFLDQRDNRSLLARYAKDKNVLNTFCYTGGFSIYALRAGARKVTSVDLSAPAMQLTEQNIALNDQTLLTKHESITSDVMEYFKTADMQRHDIVVVDPPAFAKSQRARHRAVQAYKRLNAAAIKRLRPGGLLFTFSCSRVVDRALFTNTIVAAGLESGRSASILHYLSQGGDHPISLYHPEGHYLKGLVLRIE